MYSKELEGLNKIGKCWYSVEADIVDFEPMRTENGAPLSIGTFTGKVRDMNRFRLKTDGKTAIDAEVLEDGRLRIIYNGCQRRRFLEDAAFASKTYESGRIVTFHQIGRQLKVYVRLANGRLKNKSWRGKKVTYNPVLHKVRIRAAV